MNSVIPPTLAPYVQQCIQQKSLTLLTSVLDTPTNWLLARFISATSNSGALGGVINSVTQTQNAISCNVVLVSIWRSFDLWSELLKKCGINLQDELSASRILYIDGLSTNSTPQPGVYNLTSLSLKDLSTSLATAQRDLGSKLPDQKTVVIIDGLDFLLAVEPLTTALDVQQLILNLQTRNYSVVVTCAADGALLHNTEATATPLETGHTTFVRLLAHGARLIFQLRPLETGQSREVSGSVRVSRGGAWDNDGEQRQEFAEGEWLYHVKGDGSVRVWGRGEA